MARDWFICGGSSKDTVPTPPLRESEGDEVSVKPAAPAADEDAPPDEGEATARLRSLPIEARREGLPPPPRSPDGQASTPGSQEGAKYIFDNVLLFFTHLYSSESTLAITH